MQYNALNAAKLVAAYNRSREMPRRVSAATERALARVAAGESVSSAAKAEGVSPSTIHRNADDFAHSVGKIIGGVVAKYGDKITATAITNVSMRPDLAASYLRHLDLPEMPTKPDGWRPTPQQTAKFWMGYYQGHLKGG